MSPNQPSENPPASATTGVGFFQQYIDKYTRDMPPAVRILTFVVFVFVVVFAFIRMVAGDYAVRGYMYEQSPVGPVPASYEIRYDGHFAATNSKGEYTIVLTSLEYAALLAQGSVELVAVRVAPRSVSMCAGSSPADTRLPTQTIRFRRLAHEFDDWMVNSPETARPKTARGAPTTVYAAGLPGDRLVIDAATLNASGTSSIGCELEATANGATYKLLSAAGGGTETGEIRLLPRKRMQFGADYYFDLGDTKPGTPVTIALHSVPNLFRLIFSSVEKFDFALPQPGAQQTVTGSSGSQLALHAASPVVHTSACTLALTGVKVIHDGTAGGTHWAFSVIGDGGTIALQSQRLQSPKYYTISQLHPTATTVPVNCTNEATTVRIEGYQTNHKAPDARGSLTIKRGTHPIPVQCPNVNNGEFQFDVELK